jgi:hypothetical protein
VGFTVNEPICKICGEGGFGIQFSMTPTGGYKFGEICTECEEALEAQTERQVDALEDNGREYPKGYDGTGAW